jgi:hypothetical protein
MPGVGEQPGWLYFFNGHLEFYSLAAGTGLLAGGDFTGRERGVEFDSKPLAEFVVIGQGFPNPFDGGVNLDIFFDPIC